jgi:hypothetical protein
MCLRALEVTYLVERYDSVRCIFGGVHGLLVSDERATNEWGGGIFRTTCKDARWGNLVGEWGLVSYLIRLD